MDRPAHRPTRYHQHYWTPICPHTTALWIPLLTPQRGTNSNRGKKRSSILACTKLSSADLGRNWATVRTAITDVSLRMARESFGQSIDIRSKTVKCKNFLA